MALATELFSWLDLREITHADLRAEARRTCSTPDGATASELLARWRDAYDLPPEADYILGQFLDVFRDQGNLREESGRLYADSEPHDAVLALVQLPAHEWARMRRYVVRGRAAWSSTP